MDPTLRKALVAHPYLLRQRAGNSAGRKGRRSTDNLSFLFNNAAATHHHPKNSFSSSVSRKQEAGRNSKEGFLGFEAADKVVNEGNPLHGAHLEPLISYSHPVAQHAVDEDVLAYIAEQRSVIVAFALVEGIDQVCVALVCGVLVQLSPLHPNPAPSLSRNLERPLFLPCPLGF
jgi:hypothetical protein